MTSVGNLLGPLATVMMTESAQVLQLGQTRATATEITMMPGGLRPEIDQRTNQGNVAGNGAGKETMIVTRIAIGDLITTGSAMTDV